MASEPDLRRRSRTSGASSTNAVADLRKELDQTAERGKQIGVMVGAVAGALLAVRTALKIRRRFRDD